MSRQVVNRRRFIQASALAASTAALPYWFTTTQGRSEDGSKNDRHVIGCIGTGGRWRALGRQIKAYGDIVAVCDVDRTHVENNGLAIAGEKTDTYEDYRKVLDRKDIDVVTIATPDHWHTKIAIEAMQAGKDVYCEKPLTLTIDEGKKICQVQRQTGRVFQVGTQQRTEFSTRDPKGKENKNSGPTFDHQFLQAVALTQSGRLGKLRRITCSIGSGPKCDTLPKAVVPTELNWNMWLGQAPMADYLWSPSGGPLPFTRCHYEFRWWYEYSGGKLTDWGAHHVDIAQWAMGMDQSGPTTVEAKATLPVPFYNGRPTIDNRYNTPTKFNVRCVFPNGVELLIRDEPGNGIWIQGDDAEIFVSRKELSDIRGDVVASLSEHPMPESDLIRLCKGKKPGDHMANFIECVRDRSTPISDVFTHHRALTTCHLANLAIRLKRPLKWDPVAEQIVGDNEANTWLAREQRKGFEIMV